MRTEIVAVAALMLVAGHSSSAQIPDPLEMTTDPADRAVMAEVASIIASEQTIVRLDAVLAKLPQPTPLRGMVQTVRAAKLAWSNDVGLAVTAVEEAMRLLPGDPRPRLIATDIFTFSGAPQRAADLWIEASRQSPEFARTSDSYTMGALVGRLQDTGDQARADRLNARLVEIGFGNAVATQRSTAALARTRESLRSGRADDALQAVTSIGDPRDLLSLFVDRRYGILWPRIAEWAGPDLAENEKRFLEELHGDWTRASGFGSATAYAKPLVAMDAHAAVVGLFLPLFDHLQVGDDTTETFEDAEFLAPVVSRSLSRLGRKAEALTLLDKVARAQPASDQGIGLNIDGAYLLLAAAELDWPQVLTRADTFLARAETWEAMSISPRC